MDTLLRLLPALFWMGLAIATFIYQGVTGADRVVLSPDGNWSLHLNLPFWGGISAGWLMVVVSLLNVLRWRLQVGVRRRQDRARTNQSHSTGQPTENPTID